MKERGNSTVLVSIILTLLLVLSGVFMTTVSKQSRAIATQGRVTESHYLAETGANRGISDILRNPPPRFNKAMQNRVIRKGSDSKEAGELSWETLYIEEDTYLFVSTGYSRTAKTTLSTKAKVLNGEVFIEYVKEL